MFLVATERLCPIFTVEASVQQLVFVQKSCGPKDRVLWKPDMVEKRFIHETVTDVLSF